MFVSGRKRNPHAVVCHVEFIQVRAFFELRAIDNGNCRRHPDPGQRFHIHVDNRLVLGGPGLKQDFKGKGLARGILHHAILNGPSGGGQLVECCRGTCAVAFGAVTDGQGVTFQRAGCEIGGKGFKKRAHAAFSGAIRHAQWRI